MLAILAFQAWCTAFSLKNALLFLFVTFKLNIDWQPEHLGISVLKYTNEDELQLWQNMYCIHFSFMESSKDNTGCGLSWLSDYRVWISNVLSQIISKKYCPLGRHKKTRALLTAWDMVLWEHVAPCQNYCFYWSAEEWTCFDAGSVSVYGYKDNTKLGHCENHLNISVVSSGLSHNYHFLLLAPHFFK